MSLYIKNKNDEYVPIEIKSVFGKDLNNKLVIVRVGNDSHVASIDDIDLTALSFEKADVLDNLDNVSIIITPYQIDIDITDESEVEEKAIYIQIRGGEDVSALEKAVTSMYKKLKNTYKTIVLPTPLTIKEYRQVKDTIKRCKMRKRRRSRG